MVADVIPSKRVDLFETFDKWRDSISLKKNLLNKKIKISFLSRKVSFGFSVCLPIEIGDEKLGDVGKSPVRLFAIDERIARNVEEGFERIPVGRPFFIRFDTTTQNRIYLFRLVSELL